MSAIHHPSKQQRAEGPALQSSESPTNTEFSASQYQTTRLVQPFGARSSVHGNETPAAVVFAAEHQQSSSSKDVRHHFTNAHTPTNGWTQRGWVWLNRILLSLIYIYFQSGIKQDYIETDAAINHSMSLSRKSINKTQRFHGLNPFYLYQSDRNTAEPPPGIQETWSLLLPPIKTVIGWK